MKKPYREGMWFDVPLGDGRRAPALLLRDRHHVLDVAAFTPDGDAAWSGSVSDRGLLLARWRPIQPPSVRADARHEVTPRFLRTAHAERTIARTCGAVMPDEPPHAAYDLGRLAALDDDALRGATVLQWRRPLEPAHERTLAAWIESGGASIRLYDEAVADLARVAPYDVRSLSLTRAPDVWCTMPSVEHLALESDAALAHVVEAFPNLRSLRVAARDRYVDVAALSRLAHLVSLDLSHVRIDTKALASLTNVRALRLSRVDGFDSVETLRRLALDTLAIEEQPRLHALRALRDIRTLEQIELRGLWQFGVDEMQWLYELQLKRATIDIGGRRKNAELYRHGSWACAWPFYMTTAEAARTNRASSAACGSETLTNESRCT